MIKKKTPVEMTDEELVNAYITGSNWLIKRQQVAGTTKNNLGQEYKHKEFMLGLDRLEDIEKEMQKRGLAY